MQVEINVTAGPAKGQRFIFDEPDCFFFGRAADAQISLPRDPYVSRQHFLLEISPPECKITDLNSKNGTIVNGVRYGGRKPPESGIKQAHNGVKEVMLKDGDEISVGDTYMKVSIQTTVEKTPKEAPSILSPEPAKRKVSCLRCNKDVTDEAGARGQVDGAEYVCRACRQEETVNPEQILENLLKEVVTQEVVSGAPSIEGYRIEAVIARGGMGVIYKATETKTGKTVAIKTMLPQVATNPDNVYGFQREIEVTRQLKHPHIVQLFEHGKAQGIFYFVLEFVDGMNLGQLIQSRGGRLSLEEVAPIMLGTLDGLAYAHRATIMMEIARRKNTYTGIVHRDLKPHNILLTQKEEGWYPKVTDFGISKSFEAAGFTNITVPGEVLGTPMYWPREQITHYKYLNPATDVFSAAAVFYEALTGEWVREGFKALLEECRQLKCFPTIPDYMNVIAGNPVIPIRKRNPAIPKPIAEVIDRALQEAEVPHNEIEMRNRLMKLRYPDAGVFRDALCKAFEEVGGSESFMLTRHLTQDLKPTGQPVESEVIPLQKPHHKIEDRSSQEMSGLESLLAGDVIYSISRSTSTTQQVALFVLDLVQSTQFVLDFGDTYFSTLIGNIHTTVKKHPSASDLIFMKSTGDGFLAVYTKMSAAFALASGFLETHVYQDIRIRMALHWGAVKIGPDGDVLGREVHRIYRIEGVNAEDRIDPTGDENVLPSSDRIFVTAQGLKQLDASVRTRFKPAGTFRLKGFDEPCKLWVLHK